MKIIPGLIIVAATLGLYVLGLLAEGFLTGRHLATPAQMAENFPVQTTQLFYNFLNCVVGNLLLFIGVTGCMALGWVGSKWKKMIQSRR